MTMKHDISNAEAVALRGAREKWMATSPRARKDLVNALLLGKATGTDVTVIIPVELAGALAYMIEAVEEI